MKIIANISKDSFTIRATHISESLLNKLQVSSCCTMLSCPSENESKDMGTERILFLVGINRGHVDKHYKVRQWVKNQSSQSPCASKRLGEQLFLSRRLRCAGKCIGHTHNIFPRLQSLTINVVQHRVCWMVGCWMGVFLRFWC